MALSNTRPWENAGLADAFTPARAGSGSSFCSAPRTTCRRPTSRLQFWFKGTGTLWLDDVVLTESADGQQWFPQIATEGVKNFMPNSSFECGAANWGSYTWGLSGWAGNLYRLEGEAGQRVAQHGQHALKIALIPKTLPVFYFDYYEPVRQPVRRVLAANHGWFRVKPGEPLTLSAFLRADAEGVAAQLAVNRSADAAAQSSDASAASGSATSSRFVPSQPFLFVAVGLDLEASQRDAATLWSTRSSWSAASAGHRLRAAPAGRVVYRNRRPGNIFTDPAQGAAFTVRAFNDTDTAADGPRHD